MKHISILLIALFTISCSNSIDIEKEYMSSNSFEYTQDNYCEMFGFIEYLYESELFGLSEPEKPTYDEMMLIAAPIIMSDTFGDTLAESDCSKVYFLMYDYFKIVYPEYSVTKYLKNIIDKEQY